MHILYHKNNVLSSSKSKKMADFAVTAGGGLALCKVPRGAKRVYGPSAAPDGAMEGKQMTNLLECCESTRQPDE